MTFKLAKSIMQRTYIFLGNALSSAKSSRNNKKYQF